MTRSDQANFGRKIGKTAQVGITLLVTGDLFDFYGDVWEWCEDEWADDLVNSPNDGRPYIKDPASGERVARGGSWFSVADRTRNSSRQGFNEDTRDGDHGFRVARAFGDGSQS